MKQTDMYTVTVKSLDEYLELVEPYKSKLYFRGQANYKYDINPSISRDQSWMEYEYSMIEEMYQKNRSEFNHPHVTIADLFKMQHYGLPTRLCDITKSPVISLYFALDNPNDMDIDAKVFVIDKIKSVKPEDFTVQSILMLVSKNIPDIQTLQVEFNQFYGTSYGDDEFKNAITGNYIIEPDYHMQNTRSFVQEGCSILFGFDIDDKGKILRQNRRSLPDINIHQEIIIPAQYKAGILLELNDKYAINRNNVLLSMESVADAIKQSNRKLLPESIIEDYSWKDEVQSNPRIKKILFEINLRRNRTKTEIRDIIQRVNSSILQKYNISSTDLACNVAIYGYVYHSSFYRHHDLVSCLTYSGKLTTNFRHNDQIADILIRWNYDTEIQGIHKVNTETSSALLRESTVALVDESLHLYELINNAISEFTEGSIDKASVVGTIKDYKKKNFKLIFQADNIPPGNEQTLEFYDVSYKLLHDIDYLCDWFLIHIERTNVEYALNNYSQNSQTVEHRISQYQMALKVLSSNLK